MNASSATRQRARRVRVLDTRGEGCGRKGDTSGILCRPWWMAASLNGVEGTCPVCQLQLPLSELEAHVQVHFGLSQSSEDPILIDDDTPSVTCLQCGMEISISEYASHDAAHRYCIPLKRSLILYTSSSISTTYLIHSAPQVLVTYRLYMPFQHASPLALLRHFAFTSHGGVSCRIAALKLGCDTAVCRQTKPQLQTCSVSRMKQQRTDILRPCKANSAWERR